MIKYDLDSSRQEGGPGLGLRFCSVLQYSKFRIHGFRNFLRNWDVSRDVAKCIGFPILKKETQKKVRENEFSDLADRIELKLGNYLYLSGI